MRYLRVHISYWFGFSVQDGSGVFWLVGFKGIRAATGFAVHVFALKSQAFGVFMGLSK